MTLDVKAYKEYLERKISDLENHISKIGLKVDSTLPDSKPPEIGALVAYEDALTTLKIMERK